MSMLVSTKRLIKLRYSKGTLLLLTVTHLTIDYLDKNAEKKQFENFRIRQLQKRVWQ